MDREILDAVTKALAARAKDLTGEVAGRAAVGACLGILLCSATPPERPTSDAAPAVAEGETRDSDFLEEPISYAIFGGLLFFALAQLGVLHKLQRYGPQGRALARCRQETLNLYQDRQLTKLQMRQRLDECVKASSPLNGQP